MAEEIERIDDEIFDPDEVFEPDHSEFGAGVVVCLAKFAEHLGHDSRHNVVYNTHRWSKMDDYERDQIREEINGHPNGDAARKYGLVISLEGFQSNPVSSAIEMWANGASDHFYDLDRDKAPESLKELASITLSMGHGFQRNDWTFEEFENVHKLFRQACLDVDKMLGVEPDWGQW